MYLIRYYRNISDLMGIESHISWSPPEAIMGGLLFLCDEL
jgi:hypothetical protein